VTSRTDSGWELQSAKLFETVPANGFPVQMLDGNRCILTVEFLGAVLEDEQGKRSVGKLIVRNGER